MTDGARFLEKKQKMAEMDQNQAQSQVFCHFLKFGLLAFREIAHNYGLQQCLTSSRGKIHKKSFWGPNLVFSGQYPCWH